MAVFTVLNGTGLNDAGIQFGSLSHIADSGIAGFPIITPTVGSIFFNDTGLLSVTGTEMGFTFPSTFSGVVNSLTYSEPAITPIFSITGMNTSLTLLSGLVTGGDEMTILAAVFSGDDTIGGSTKADKLFGFDGHDAISGGDGNDVLAGGAGGDNLDGGNGSDFANYQGSTTGVTIDLLNHTASGGDAEGDTLTSIENLYASAHDDHLTGDNGANIIGGWLGTDTIIGNDGNDVLAGEAGDDTLDGGAGNDRLVGAAGVDTIHGGDGNDSIDAGADQDFVFGEVGNDSIAGGAGDDLIDGGDGNDIIEGGAGGDLVMGGAGIDTVSYLNSAAGVTVFLTGTGSGGDAQGDALSGIEQAMGSAFADHLGGDANNNQLWGFGGDDVLVGAGGADNLKGGAGNDTFVYLTVADSTVAPAGKDAILDFTTGDKIDLSLIDADGNPANGDAAFAFAGDHTTGHGAEVQIVNFGNGVQGVYLYINADKLVDSIINVVSDHALTAADFVL
jgi:Ca2+-binding RTX toxin-like protein